MYQPIDLASGATIIFSQKLFEDFYIQQGNHHVYSHHFFTAIPKLQAFWLFLEIALFFVCSLRIQRPEHPNFFLKKLYEDIHIESENYDVYSHYFFTLIDESIWHFLRITQNSLFFCVYQHPNCFSQTFLRTSKQSWRPIAYTYNIFFTPIFASTRFFYMKRTNCFIFHVYQPMDLLHEAQKKLSQQLYKDHRIELGTITYTLLQVHSQKFHRFLYYSCVFAHGSGAQSTQNKFLK